MPLEQAKRFHALFAGLERAHGVYIVSKTVVEGEKRKGRALTEQAPVTDELWLAHLEGKRGIGIAPLADDGNVRWACIDIDAYPLDHAAIEETLRSHKLPLVVLKSKSGGAHLILFLAEPIPAKTVRAILERWAVLIGYPDVEIFPKQNALRGPSDIGNWLNMPYFGGETSSRCAIYEGKPLGVNDFLQLAEGRRVTREALELFASVGETSFDEAPPCLQHLVKSGFPRGTRNRGLFNLGVYSRLAFGDDWQAKVDEMNRTHMNPPLSSGEVMSTVKSLSRKTYFYTCSADPIASVCNKDICRQRKYGIGEGTATAAAPAQVGSITKILSDPPVYVVEVEGVKVECSADDLLSQLRFRKLVFERANRVVPLLKAQLWDALLNEKMATLDLVEAPADAGPEGQFKTHLDNFCTSRVVASSLDEMLLGKPFVNPEDGRTYFRSTDLLRYLEQMHFREFNERRIWAILKRDGCQHHQFSLKGKCVTAWSIETLKAQDAPFDAPKIDGSDL